MLAVKSLQLWFQLPTRRTLIQRDRRWGGEDAIRSIKTTIREVAESPIFRHDRHRKEGGAQEGPHPRRQIPQDTSRAAIWYERGPRPCR